MASTAAKRENVDIEWVCADMREFRREESYDGVINLFTSFGYFEDFEQDRRTAGNMCASLRPGGVLVMQLMGKEVLARIFRPRDWHEQDGLLVLEERKVRDSWSWIESRWPLISAEGRVDLDGSPIASRLSFGRLLLQLSRLLWLDLS